MTRVQSFRNVAHHDVKIDRVPIPPKFGKISKRTSRKLEMLASTEQCLSVED